MRKYQFLLLAPVAVLFLIPFYKSAPNQILARFPNDSNTGYYLSYARNLDRYPLSLTHGMNVDLVGEPPKWLSENTVVGSFYIDHPMGVVWTTALFLKVFPNSVIAGRSVSILSSVSIAIILIAIALSELGVLSAVGTAFALIATPVFWTHGLVLNFEPFTCLWSALSLYFFSKYLFQESKHAWTLAMLFWAIGMLSDWPAFFVGVPVGLVLIYRREWKRLFGAFTFSLSFFALTELYFAFYLKNPRLPLTFFLGAFANHPDPHYAWRAVIPAVSKNFIFNFGLALPVASLIAIFSNRDWKIMKLPLFFVLGMAFLATLNIVIFKPWAADHRFWSYYYLPAIGLGTGLLISRRSLILWKTRLALGICLLGVALTSLPTIHSVLTDWRNLQTFEQADLSGLSLTDPGVTVIARGYEAYFGHGYIARWYLDKAPVILNQTFKAEDTNLDNAILVVGEQELETLKAPIRKAFVPIDQFNWLAAPLKKVKAESGLSYKEIIELFKN